MKKIKNLSFFTYQQLSSLNSKNHLISKLDNVQQEILVKVVDAFVHDSPLGISDLMSYRNIASPATIHSRLKKMIAIGFIDVILDKDERCKRLIPTALAKEYYEQESSLMEQALDR